MGGCAETQKLVTAQALLEQLWRIISIPTHNQNQIFIINVPLENNMQRCDRIVYMEGLMSKKTLGILLIVLGVILAGVSLTADTIGIGVGAFGTKQYLGTAIGIIVAFVGVWLALSKSNQKK
jgi:predicted phage tail protein